MAAGAAFLAPPSDVQMPRQRAASHVWLLQLRFQLGDLLLRNPYQALPSDEVGGVGVAATM